MKVTELFTVEALEEAISEGYVRRVKHPELPLWILGYTEKAQYESRWNRVTLNCRGLIIDSDYNVVARPWKKFFNAGEKNVEFDYDSPVEVTDKVDGSLGILYCGNGAEIATRGSFTSEQAIHANKIWKEKYREVRIPVDYTFLFEIVYPANCIVVSYDFDDLVLLGAVNIEYGYYLGPNEAAGLLDWPGPKTEVFPYRTFNEAYAASHRRNAEGFVIRSGNKMVKVKYPDYVDLHRIVTNLNERTVWEQLGRGLTIQEICEPLPDELHAWVQSVADNLRAQLVIIMNDILDEFVAIQPGLDRKSFAMIASKSKSSGYLFKLYDGKSIQDDVWKTLRPDVSKE